MIDPSCPDFDPSLAFGRPALLKINQRPLWRRRSEGSAVRNLPAVSWKFQWRSTGSGKLGGLNGSACLIHSSVMVTRTISLFDSYICMHVFSVFVRVFPCLWGWKAFHLTAILFVSPEGSLQETRWTSSKKDTEKQCARRQGILHKGKNEVGVAVEPATFLDHPSFDHT